MAAVVKRDRAKACRGPGPLRALTDGPGLEGAVGGAPKDKGIVGWTTRINELRLERQWDWDDAPTGLGLRLELAGDAIPASAHVDDASGGIDVGPSEGFKPPRRKPA